jgi:hypothetical protein
MANDISNIKSINGTSMNLNTAPGCGANKPMEKAGTSNPGNTKPKRVENGSSPIAK